jgi:hypothetical protein
MRNCAGTTPDLTITVLLDRFGPAWRASSASKHHKFDLSVFDGSIRQMIAGHFLDLCPVLAKIPQRLLLRRKLCRYAAGLARITVRDLKKYRLRAFFKFPSGRQSIAHCLFLYESLARARLLTKQCGYRL